MARFQAVEVALQAIAALQPLVTKIARHDRNLAMQLRDAASSMPLNVSEGARREGGDRLHHYRIAAGSADEARTALRVAIALRYVAAEECADADALLDSELALLWRLTHPRR